MAVPSQALSHICYMCVAKDHSGTLLAKDDLCVEVVDKDGKPCMHHYQLHLLHIKLLHLHACYVTFLTITGCMTTIGGVLE